MISRIRDTSRHDGSFIGSCTLHPVLDLSFSHVSCSRPYLCKSFEVHHLRKPISNGSFFSMFKRQKIWLTHADTKKIPPWSSCPHLSRCQKTQKAHLVIFKAMVIPQVPELIYHDMVIPP